MKKIISTIRLFIIAAVVVISCKPEEESVKIKVEGIVIDAVDGSPVNDASVRLYDQLIFGSKQLKMVFTNMQGEYFIQALVECSNDEEYIVSANKGARPSVSKRIPCTGDTQTINFELQPADTLIVP